MYKLLFFVQLCVLCTVISSVSGSSFWDSLVNVDRADNGDKKVGVHLPFIYWMDLNRNKEGPKLDISVLGGLVKVNVDRSKNPTKRPVMVRLLGQKIYNSYPDGLMPGQLASYGNQYQGDESNKDVIAFKPNEYRPIEPLKELTSTESNKVQESSSVAYDVPPQTDKPATLSN